jgi:hypothetical protein
LTLVVDLIVGVTSWQQQSNTRVLVVALRRQREGSREYTNTATTPYAPANAYPLKLGTATIEAVDRIGLTACGEIEKTADDIICGANEAADNLRQLATAIREHSKVASVHVADFCKKATTVIEGVRDLQDRLLAGQREGEAEETEDDKSPLPKVIRSGPANGEDHGPCR